MRRRATRQWIRKVVVCVTAGALLLTPTPARTAPAAPGPDAEGRPRPGGPDSLGGSAGARSHDPRPSHTPPDPCDPAAAAALRESDPLAALTLRLGIRLLYTYADGVRYLLCARPLHLTDVQLQPGEQLLDVSAGDTVRWVIGTTQSGTGADTRIHLLIKPLEPGLETNLVITTDRRAYQLLARSSATHAHPAIAWTYPQDELRKLRAAHAEQARLAEQTVATGLAPERLRFGYTIRAVGRYAWTPLRAFDDGTKTYIQFPPELKASEAPALFLKRDNELHLVNYRVQGDFYVVDRLFEAAELRVGPKEVVTITRDQHGRRSWSWPRPADDDDRGGR